MSHLHIPDGIIATWLWVLGYILVGIYFLVFRKFMKNHKKLAIAGVIGALMILTMSIPIPLALPYHINLSALAGILLGPFYAGIAIFSVNLILALVGHGGITIVGLNTVVIMLEAVIAWALFRRSKNAFISTLFALIVASILTFGVVYLGTQELGLLVHDHCDCGHAHHHEHETMFDPGRFLTMVLLVGSIGWTLESFITAFIVNYINKVKPDLIDSENN